MEISDDEPLGDDLLSEVCHQCGTEKARWNGALLCVVCDNDDNGRATWFVKLVDRE